jgi:hypothetical protein
VAFSPDGATLVSAGHDGTVLVWNLSSRTETGRPNGTGVAAATRPARLLAGVQSDRPSAEDLLKVGDDVAMLAELIAAAETTPPLAIALTGNWGTGKSSVMLQVEQAISKLARQAADSSG